jgi:hypothetical protein
MKEAKKKEDEIKGKIMLGNTPELKNLITNNAASNLSARSIASTP